MASPRSRRTEAKPRSNLTANRRTVPHPSLRTATRRSRPTPPSPRSRRGGRGIDGVWSAIIVAEACALVLTMFFLVYLRKPYGYA